MHKKKTLCGEFEKTISGYLCKGMHNNNMYEVVNIITRDDLDKGQRPT